MHPVEYGFVPANLMNRVQSASSVSGGRHQRSIAVRHQDVLQRFGLVKADKPFQLVWNSLPPIQDARHHLTVVSSLHPYINYFCLLFFHLIAVARPDMLTLLIIDYPIHCFASSPKWRQWPEISKQPFSNLPNRTDYISFTNLGVLQLSPLHEKIWMYTCNLHPAFRRWNTDYSSGPAILELILHNVFKFSSTGQSDCLWEPFEVDQAFHTEGWTTAFNRARFSCWDSKYRYQRRKNLLDITGMGFIFNLHRKTVSTSNSK